MLRNLTALSVALFLLIAPAASAVPLGIQDDGQSSSAVAANTAAVGGTWTRTTVAIGSPDAAQRIRDAHAAGQKIILTVGGTGTRTRRPSFMKALRYIHGLPKADKYTIDNEPDLDGVSACTYRKGWMKARRSLGRRLLWGDTSPAAPFSFTLAARRCGPLPKTLDFAIHPYQSTDPLAHGELEGGIGNLGHAKRWLKMHAGVKVNWWLTEFGYVAASSKSLWRITDAEAAWMWPRAVKQAARNHARVLIAYTAQGASWDTRPRPLAWCSLTSGHACPGAQRPDDHRKPIEETDESSTEIRVLDPVVQEMLDYASA